MYPMFKKKTNRNGVSVWVGDRWVLDASEILTDGEVVLSKEFVEVEKEDCEYSRTFKFNPPKSDGGDSKNSVKQPQPAICTWHQGAGNNCVWSNVARACYNEPCKLQAGA